MDTKWKNRKKAISFMIFALGVTLTLWGITGLMRDKPRGAALWQLGEILENDYQESGRFRGYIGNRLENLLAIAAGGVPENTWIYDNGDAYLAEGGSSYYYNYAYDDQYYGDYWNYIAEKESQIANLESLLDELDALQENYQEMLEDAEENPEAYSNELGIMSAQEMEACRKQLEEEIAACRSEATEDGAQSQEGYDAFGRKKLSEEEKKEIAQKYHDTVKGDKNVLYSVSYDGKVLYANSDALSAEGGMAAPEGKAADGTELAGYNFFLYFDGEKVRIVKDGQELDVYGDGYYREGTGADEGSMWYVPGYYNFPADESIKKARVCIAAAAEPVIYTEGAYGKGGSRQYDNALYWLNYNCLSSRKALFREAVCLTIGIGLLLLSLLFRKSRREALTGIAGFQGKIWVEAKVLLLFGALCAEAFIMIRSSYEYGGYGLWEEIVVAYDYEYGTETVLALGREIMRNLSPLFWIVLFWTVYFIWNDLRHNKKVWKQGLIAGLWRTFSVKNLNQALSRKAAVRNAALFAGAASYAAFMAVLLVIRRTARGNEAVWISGTAAAVIIGLLAALGTAAFLILAYAIGRKNMETARDLEVLALNVGEIRKGNYTDIGGDFSGHDLDGLMTQLEDIRHGMAKAVDEQMKSERMKVELIANVSHDIKTPLTSIISYVQFLKQEEGLPDHVRDYVTILDEKSQRLKNMVQDVFAVSKAASGELPMHMERLDFGKLLRQTMADMEEQISKSAVSFRTEIPEDAVMIMADGQRMYRVFQNLFQNAIKYSLDGSRVYVTLKTDGELAVASVKNTSQLELARDRDFTERFIRGDESRTDGGSGLGLSIAQSFTEACGGAFSWETDADLFVVRVSFKVAD
ncbi:MAG: hypothetical protein HFI99_14035 [Lachnospiraceae bacterium]|nr:hypothetical protein [Lachnospiraceae bacterium]